MLWITTDTHFDDALLVQKGHREAGYEKDIFKNLQQLGSSDVLFHLGDICREDADVRKVHEKYIQPLQCRKVLIRGNHDMYMPSWYKAHGWDEVYDTLLVHIAGKRVLLSHMPQRDIGIYDVNIHGHFHDRPEKKYAKAWSHILTEKHILLSLEAESYKATPLHKLIYHQVLTFL